MSRRLVLAVALGVLTGPPSSAAAPSTTIHIYHTDDVHGWIMVQPDKERPGHRVGGAAVLKAWLAQDQGPKLVLDAGDWWQGTPEGTLTKGTAVAEVFNAVGYDAVAIGNHEFDAGQDELRVLIAKMRMPVLGANIYGADGRRVPWAKPWIVKEVGGVKFGIFGLLTTHIQDLRVLPKDLAGLTFRREVDEARDDVAALRRAGAEVIIAVTHVGFEDPSLPKFEGDQTIAREVPGIDLIVGGHTHTVLDPPYRDPVHGTLIVRAGSYLTHAGRVTLTIDSKTRRLIASSGEVIVLDPDRFGEDPAVKTIVAKHTQAVAQVFDAVVATATAKLLGRGEAADKENSLGSWMADCYRGWAAADVALQNGDGIRADISGGPVLFRDIFNAFPFANRLVKLRLTGAQLRAALDHGIGDTRRLVQVSGLSAQFDRAKPAGQRLAAVAVGGAPLDDARSYSVVTLDFMVGGGDGYTMLGAASAAELTGTLARDVLRQCAEKQKNIAPPVPGRLKARRG